MNNEEKKGFTIKRLLIASLSFFLIALTLLILIYAIYNSTGQERGWNIIMIVWGSLLTLSIVVYCVYQTVKYLIQNRDEKRK